MYSDLIEEAWASSNLGQLLSLRKRLKHADLRQIRADQLTYLGIACAVKKQYKLAAPCFWIAFEKDKENADYRLNLANCLKDLADFRAALEVYTGANGLDERDPQLSLGAAICEIELGQYANAIPRLEKATKTWPSDPRINYQYARCLFKLERVEESITHYKNSLQSDPTFEPAATNLVISLFKAGDLNSAYALADQIFSANAQTDHLICSILTVALDSGAPDIGMMLFDKNTKKMSPQVDYVAAEVARYMKDAKKAVKLGKRVMARNPEHFANRVVLVQALSDLGRFADADQIKSTLFSKFDVGTVSPQQLPNPWSLFSMTGDLKTLTRAAVNYANYSYNVLPREKVWSSEAQRSVRGGIGFFGPDFGNHPVAECLLPVFKSFTQPEKAHILSIRSQLDSMTDEFKRLPTNFHDCKDKSFAQIQAVCRDHGIDTLVDLAVYTTGGRANYCALGLAPTQVNYLGYSGSSGARAYDYIIGDKFIIPDGLEEYYSEEVIKLDEPLLGCALRSTSRTTPMSRGEYGVPNDAIVFGCLAQFYKFSGEMVRAWSEILRRCPDSVLLLSAADERTQTAVLKGFLSRGVSQDRIYFGRREPTRDLHISRLKMVDIFLDTFPYNAHSLAADALSAGVPLVTLTGTSFASRVAGSLLFSLSCEETVAETFEEYIETAVELAQNCEKRRGISANITSRLEERDWAGENAKVLWKALSEI